MGNFVSDKNVVKSRSLAFDPPNSAAALYQFLSQYPDETGVKLEGAYTAPVIKIRKNEAQKLDADSRKAWSYYLAKMQESLTGTENAVKAAKAIELLLTSDPVRLSVGKMLGPLEYLMKAEQDRLAGANSYVKCWLANEKLVLQIVVPHDPSGEFQKKEDEQRAALATACGVLSKFTESENGEINTDSIRDQAYAIGQQLSEEEVSAIWAARMKLVANREALGGYVGPEAQWLISLCVTAHGKTQTAFRLDDSVKSDVAQIAFALRARTATNIYATISPRTRDKDAAQRSMPVFSPSPASSSTASTTASTTTASTSPTSTPPKDSPPRKNGSEARTPPPTSAPPPVPEGKPPVDPVGTQGPGLAASAPADRPNRTYGRPTGFALNMNAALHEMKDRQQADAGNGEETGLRDVSSSSPRTPRDAILSSSGLSASSTASTFGSNRGPSRGDAKSPRIPSDRKRLADLAAAVDLRQKSDGETPTQQREKTVRKKRRVKSMESRSPDAAAQQAISAAGEAARTLKADLVKATTDSANYRKWEAAEAQLKDVLTPEMSKSVGRLMSYCHKVDLEQGKEQSSLDKVIKTLRPQVRERRAFIAVRDILLAESRGEAETKAASAFPELLTLLIFAIDAERTWRQEHDSKAAH